MNALHGLLASALVLLTGCSGRRSVASSFPDGRPEVVVHYKGTGEKRMKVMEQVYHPNGKLDYVGRFKNGKEHGEWNYYYEDGTRKFTEHWKQGAEDGVQVEYAPDGRVLRETYYDRGILIRTVDRTGP